MTAVVSFLAQYGYGVLFALVFAEQVGLPLPALPILVGTGALAATERMSVAVALPVAVAASLLADLAWFQLGRSRGRPILGLLCRITREPRSCVHRTEALFDRHGAGVLVAAKFIPGLTLVAPPLAGVAGMSRARFLAFSGVAASLWAVGLGGVGYLFHGELERAVALALRLGTSTAVAAGIGLVAYVAWRYRRWSGSARDTASPTSHALGSAGPYCAAVPEA